MDMDSAFQAQLGDTELWRLVNTSSVTHLFHVHGVAYQIVDRDGSPPPPEEAGWKDTVMVHPNETVRIIMTFRDYADLDHPFMYHCHILPHVNLRPKCTVTLRPKYTTTIGGGSANLRRS